MTRSVAFRLLCGFIIMTPVVPTDAVAQAPAPSGRIANLSELALAPGDMIRLSFWREPAMNGDYPIDESGRVVLPLLGARHVSSTAPVELIDRLTQDYDVHLNNQQVNITLLRRIRVLGSVQNPGVYHINPTMTLSDALALAGGATSDGKLNGVRLLRDGNTISTNLERAGRLTADIRSGDQIFVPERSWFSRHSRVVVGGVLSAATLIVTQAIFR